MTGLSPQPTHSKKVQPVKAVDSVAALGQLEPAGDIRKLAPPVSAFGGTPRVLSLMIREGDEVTQGQVLAVFDSRPQILADLSVLDSRIETLVIQIHMQEREVSRYQQAAIEGATAIVLLEEKQDELTQL